MATLARELLTADQAELRINCLGMSYVGIKLSGTWVGTADFSASQADMGASGPGGGAAFKPVGVYTQGSGTGTVALSATANGTWYWPVQNYATFKVVFTRTSGSLLAALAASIDSSWGDAFLTPAGKFLNSYANGVQNRLTIAADANMGRRLRSLVVTAAPHTGGGGAGTGSSSIAGPASASWSGNPVLRIYDGNETTGSLIWSSDLQNALPFEREVPLPKVQTNQYGVTDGGLYFTPGGIGTILLASGGGNVSTNINAEIATA